MTPRFRRLLIRIASYVLAPVMGLALIIGLIRLLISLF